MEALEEPAAANGQGAEDKAGSTAARLVPDGQERLLFFASVLIGHKVEVQVSWGSGSCPRAGSAPLAAC
jgi:hypothetical protein